jgi:hypothetical protein
MRSPENHSHAGHSREACPPRKRTHLTWAPASAGATRMGIFIKLGGPLVHGNSAESQGSRRWDPLTPPAPAAENAGCGPPSSPRGRGIFISVCGLQAHDHSERRRESVIWTAVQQSVRSGPHLPARPLRTILAYVWPPVKRHEVPVVGRVIAPTSADRGIPTKAKATHFLPHGYWSSVPPPRGQM